MLSSSSCSSISLLCMLTTSGSFHLVKEEKLDFHQTIHSNTCWHGTCCSPAKNWSLHTNHHCVWCERCRCGIVPNHYCAIAVIIPRLNLPALYAETIELIPTRKWQLVMWGKMDFTVLRYCEGPWDNTVNTIKRRLNWCSCEMCSAWIKAYWSGVSCQRLCCVHVSPRASKKVIILFHWFILMNYVHIWGAIFFIPIFFSFFFGSGNK